MEYRIVETEQPCGDWLDHVAEIGHYDSAYTAMKVMRRALISREERARNWYVVDHMGRILVGPDDIEDLGDPGAA